MTTSKYSFNTFTRPMGLQGRKGYSKHTETYRVCDTCCQSRETVIHFSKDVDTDEYNTVCNQCRNGGKTKAVAPRRRSRLAREMAIRERQSHENLLDQALNQKPEVTDLSQLRAMYPQYDEEKLLRLQRLNQKINVANDFLIEEQSAWLDPSSRPSGGIPYNEDLFGVPFATDEDDADAIQSEVYDEKE